MLVLNFNLKFLKKYKKWRKALLKYWYRPSLFCWQVNCLLH